MLWYRYRIFMMMCWLFGLCFSFVMFILWMRMLKVLCWCVCVLKLFIGGWLICGVWLRLKIILVLIMLVSSGLMMLW